jgi:hypothetical protein
VPAERLTSTPTPSTKQSVRVIQETILVSVLVVAKLDQVTYHKLSRVQNRLWSVQRNFARASAKISRAVGLYFHFNSTDDQLGAVGFANDDLRAR